MVTRQTIYNRGKDCECLRALIPHDAPLLVVVDDAHGFRVQHLDGDTLTRGRYQVVHACIVGFLRAWGATR